MYGTPPSVKVYILLLYCYDGFEEYTSRSYVKILLTVYNEAPTYTGSGISISCYVNNMCNYTVNANDFSDPEGDSLSFDLKVKQVSGMAPYSNVFPWLTFSANKKQISGTPIFADVGTYTLVV